MDPVVVYVIVVVFAATLVRSALGFGEALVAVPLLVMRVPAAVAVPLAVLVSVLVAGVVMAQDWREVHFRSAAGLVGATVVGVPVGLWVLVKVNEGAVKLVLAGVIAAFSAYSLAARRPMRLERDRWEWLLGVGFVAGILGGAYGINGPPLAVYGAMRRWAPQQFRATLQAYFLPASLCGVVGYWAAGLMSAEVWRLFAVSLPGALVATWLGREINRRLRGHGFLTAVHWGLIAVAAVLAGQVLRH